MRITILDCHKMTDRDTAYDYLQKELRLPEYFGHNLDALADCLGELSDDDIIVLMYSDQLKENLGRYGEKMIDVFEELSCFEGSFILVRK